MRDADSDVRNNAARALVVFAEYSPKPSTQKVNVPPEPFTGMLKSYVWSDRNKSAAALAQLSARHDPKLLSQLREEALPALFEMASWKYLGYACYSLEILGRLAGLSDGTIQNAPTRGDRMAIIAAAKEAANR